MYIYHTWQIVGVLATGCRPYYGPKTVQGGKKRRKIAKINPKSKEKLPKRQVNIWLPSYLLKFLPGVVYIYVCIYIAVVQV